MVYIKGFPEVLVRDYYARKHHNSKRTSSEVNHDVRCAKYGYGIAKIELIDFGNRLFEHTKHGDEDHQAWLKKTIDEFIKKELE